MQKVVYVAINPYISVEGKKPYQLNDIKELNDLLSDGYEVVDKMEVNPNAESAGIITVIFTLFKEA